MQKKVLVFLIGVFLTGAGVSRAQTAQAASATPVATAAASPVSVVITPTFVSQYMFRGSRLGGFSFQPSAEVDYGSLALGVWADLTLSGKDPGQPGPEIDPYGSYTFTVNDSLSIQPGFSIYTYVEARLDQGYYHATFEPNLAVNYTLGRVTLTPKVYYDTVLDGATYELTAVTSIPLNDQGAKLNFSGTLGTFLQQNVSNHADPEVKNWGNYWQLGVSAPFTLTKSSTLTVGFAWTAGTGDYYKQGPAPKVVNTTAVSRGVFTVSYAWTF